MYKSSSQLKQEVRDAYRGKWGKMVLLNLVPSLLVMFTIIAMVGLLAFFVAMIPSNWESRTESAVQSLEYFDYDDDTDFYLDDDDWDTDLESYGDTSFGISLPSLIWEFILSLLTIGILFTSLDILRNPRLTIQPLQSAFRLFNRKDFISVFLIELLISIFTFLWSLLFFIPGVVKAFAYSQAQFIYKDLSTHSNQESVSATFYITESRKLMAGHKGRLFALYLTFIGWFILIPLTFGLATLWVYPYLNGTLAAFYKDLAKEQYLPEYYEENLEKAEAEEWTDF